MREFHQKYYIHPFLFLKKRIGFLQIDCAIIFLVCTYEGTAFLLKEDKYMEIREYTIEKINDPTGILSGERYEYFLSLEVEEEDDLASEQGLQLKVLFFIEEDHGKILNYHFYNSIEDKYLDFALEEEELAEITAFCKEHFTEAE